MSTPTRNRTFTPPGTYLNGRHTRFPAIGTWQMPCGPFAAPSEAQPRGHMVPGTGKKPGGAGK